jgi:hypothetical protein
MLVGSLLTKEHLTSWLYTANAATASKRPAFASLSAWLIASHPKPCTDRSSNARRELAHERAFDGLAVYGECRDSEQKAKRLRTCLHGSLRPTQILNSSKNRDLSQRKTMENDSAQPGGKIPHAGRVKKNTPLQVTAAGQEL